MPGAACLQSGCFHAEVAVHSSGRRRWHWPTVRCSFCLEESRKWADENVSEEDFNASVVRRWIDRGSHGVHFVAVALSVYDNIACHLPSDSDYEQLRRAAILVYQHNGCLYGGQCHPCHRAHQLVCRSGTRGERAGYTTLRTSRNELMQRDPYMGRVIRLAGATPLERHHFLQIVAATKVQVTAEATSRKAVS